MRMSFLKVIGSLVAKRPGSFKFLITIELQPASAGAGGTAGFVLPHKPVGPPWYRVESGG